LEEFSKSKLILEVQARFNDLASDQSKNNYGSWFLTDSRGLQIARWPESKTTGRNFAWRSYFHGGKADQRDEHWRQVDGQRLRDTQLSAAYQSQSTNRWVVAVSTPVTKRNESGERQFLGVLGRSKEIGSDILNLPDGASQFAVLVDGRDGDRPGLVLQHPLFDTAKPYEEGRLPARFEGYRITGEMLPDAEHGDADYRDPLGDDPDGAEYQQRFLAAQAPIEVRGERTGWLVIVQDKYDDAIGETIDGLRSKLMASGQVALAFIAVVMLGLWAMVVRMSEKPARWKPIVPPAPPSIAETLPARRQDT
jgi:hypothetical protein